MALRPVIGAGRDRSAGNLPDDLVIIEQVAGCRDDVVGDPVDILRCEAGKICLSGCVENEPFAADVADHGGIRTVDLAAQQGKECEMNPAVFRPLCRQATLQHARRKRKMSFHVGVHCRYHRVRFDKRTKHSRAVQVWHER
jgi:hypothetical protein